MIHTLKTGIFALSFVFASLLGLSQSIENVNAQVSEGNKVAITYDLKGNPDQDRFSVKVYSSHNGFSSPLNQVTGDVSRTFSISPGNNKKIIWDALREINSFNGELSFEVRAEVYHFLRLTKPASGKSVRRGATTLLTWTGGIPSENVKIELLKSGTVLSDLGTRNNTGTYNWSVPKELEKGHDYSLRFSSNSGTVTSDNFSVNAKYPLALKAGVPALAIGAVILLSGGGGDESSPLPVPPEPN